PDRTIKLPQLRVQPGDYFPEMVSVLVKGLRLQHPGFHGESVPQELYPLRNAAFGKLIELEGPAWDIAHGVGQHAPSSRQERHARCQQEKIVFNIDEDQPGRRTPGQVTHAIAIDEG